jgi:hypothetical protein
MELASEWLRDIPRSKLHVHHLVVEITFVKTGRKFHKEFNIVPLEFVFVETLRIGEGSDKGSFT